MEVEIHTSDRKKFKDCRQLWQFSSPLQMNLEPEPTGPNPYWFGTGIHEALAAYYDDPYRISQGWPCRQPDVAVGTWYNYCGASEFKVDDETMDLGAGMLRYYCKWASKHDSEYFNKIVHVETEQRSKLYTIGNGTDVIYSYRLDGLVQDKHGRYYILEHKTAGQFSSSYDFLLTDNQVSSYIEREQERLNLEIEGMIYTVLKKKVPQRLKVLKSGAFSKDMSQDTTFEIAKEDIIGKYGQIPAEYTELLHFLSTKPNNFIHREVVRRTQQELKNTKQEMLWEISDMISDPKIYRSPSPQNCNKCAFLLPCVVKWEGRDIKPVLRVGYRQRKSYVKTGGSNG